MSTSGSSKIASPAEGDHSTPRTRPAPTRAELRGARSLKTGGASKADLLIVELESGPVVVKDFAAKRPWVRALGRLLIRREYLAYRWLGPMEGVPRLVGRVDGHALALELIPGARQLGYAEAQSLRERHGPRLFARLREVVERLHDSGLVHWDLRTRDNVIVGEDGRPYVIDFASAVWLRPGGLAHRWLFRRMCRVDAAALLKWRQLLGAGSYSEEEEAFLRRFRFWRSLWVFNPKPGKRDPDRNP